MEFLIYGIGGLVVGGLIGFLLTIVFFKNKEKRRQAEVQKAREKIEGITQEINLLKGETEEKDKGLSSLKQKFEDTKNVLAQKEEEEKNLRERMQEFQEQIKEANEAVHIKGERLEALQEERDQCKVFLDEKEKENTALNEKIGLLSGENDELNEKLAKANKARESLGDELKAKDRELEEVKADLKQKGKELEERQSELEEKREKLEQVKSDYSDNISLRARVLYELKHSVELLESIPIPEEFEYEEEDVEFSMEDSVAIDELTVQLAEQEKQLGEKQEKIGELSQTLLLSDQQDSIIQQLSQDLKKQEKQFEELGKARADLLEKIEIHEKSSREKEKIIAAKEEMIQKYIQKIEALEEKKDDSVPTDTRGAIGGDPNLSRGQQQAMLLLYSQYETKKDHTRRAEPLAPEKPEESENS